jgi:hypothetical protein
MDKKTPPKAPGRNGYKYRQQFALVVPCKDEPEQQRRYTRLLKMGYRPKVVCV